MSGFLCAVSDAPFPFCGRTDCRRQHMHPNDRVMFTSHYDLRHVSFFEYDKTYSHICVSQPDKGGRLRRLGSSSRFLVSVLVKCQLGVGCSRE